MNSKEKKSKMPKETSAGAITFLIKDRKIHYLLLKSVKGHWGFPKGRVEGAESLVETAKREIEEEIGNNEFDLSDKKEWRIYYEFSDVQKEAVYYLAKIFNEEINISDEHTKHGLFDFDEAISKLEFEDIKEVLTKANDFIKNNF